MKTVLVATCIVGLALRAAPGAAQAPDGQALYQQNCRACHGARGVPPERLRAVYKTLPTFDSAFVAARSDDSLVAVVQNGAGRNMRGFKEKRSKEETLAIVRYLRTPRGGAAGTP